MINRSVKNKIYETSYHINQKCSLTLRPTNSQVFDGYKANRLRAVKDKVKNSQVCTGTNGNSTHTPHLIFSGMLL